MTFNHTMADGIGIVQFMNALAEMVKGGSRPSVLPVWKREILRPRTKPTVKFPLYEYDQIEDKDGQLVSANELIHKSFFFLHKEIEWLKRQAVGKGKYTTFEVLSAFLWRLRTKAVQLAARQEARLIFTVDARNKSEPPLPEGFYGNAISLACAKATTEELANKPLSFAVKLINEAKTAVNDEYLRSAIDLMELKGRHHCTVVNTFFVSDVSKMRFRDVDFGWGGASYGGLARGGVGVVPGLVNNFISHCNTSGVEGIVVPLCLPSAAMRRFEAEINHAIHKAPAIPRSSL